MAEQEDPIDELLSKVVRLQASDLHVAARQPPVVRCQGRFRQLGAEVLDLADVMALAKSITPDRCLQELQEKGGTAFVFTLGETSFQAAVFRCEENMGVVLKEISGDLS